MSGATHLGRCNCGAISYAVKGDPQAVVACHCLNCQRQSGSAFSVNWLLTSDQLKIEGQPKLYIDPDSESGTPVERHFCGNCGSPIISKSANLPGMAILKAGTLDEREGFAPQLHCWTDTAFSWSSVPNGIPSMPRNPPAG